jgi:hypothetical protein
MRIWCIRIDIVLVLNTKPAAMQDLGLYGLIRRIGLHFPQWDSNPRSNRWVAREAKEKPTSYISFQEKMIRPKIKYRLFPLSDRPTKIAATQKILLPHLRKKNIFYQSYLNSVDVSNKFAIDKQI